MSLSDQHAYEVRDVLRTLIEGADMIDEDTLLIIARGEDVDYNTDISGASLDLGQVVEVLRTFVPIVSGMIGIVKNLYDLSKARSKTPSAEEIIKAYVAQFGAMPAETKGREVQIAQAVVARV